ncbi:hypothetical protein HU200_027612 [Digitaria exilis]|uniref:non-specific serine/threonine protein kinase n=1 Tax=Digitaria exilis TaxID=1010633 RepID=A0A835ETL7_9POAL|nr:hypothetical protein HU200_027612 [Digitaria exilis]
MAHIFLILLLLQLPHSITRAQHIISIGSTLKPEGPNRSWLSPSGDFAFGFISLDTNSSLYLLAIWFDQIDEKTIVWYTNGSTPVSSGSSLQFTNTGTLSLLDSTGAEVWSPPISGGAYASMNDTGNFVIYGEDGSPKWQSFTAPADTILPSKSCLVALSSKLSLWTAITQMVAAVFDQDGHCWKKRLPLSNGNEGTEVQRTVFLKIPNNNYSHPPMNIESRIEGDEEAIINMKTVERFIRVALWCIQDEPAMRPTMHKVIMMLDGAIEAPQPPIDTPTFISSLL